MYTVSQFRALGAWIDQARRNTELRHMAKSAADRYSARSYLDAALALGDPFMPALRSGDDNAKVLLATACAAADIPVGIDGLSFVVPDLIDTLEVGILDGHTFVPFYPQHGPCPLTRHTIKFLACRRCPDPHRAVIL